MVLNLRTPKFRNFTFAELREDVVKIRNLRVSSYAYILCIAISTHKYE